MILYNGATGSIGSSMPAPAVAVSTRLEATIDEMSEDLHSRVNGKPYAFIHLAGLVSVDECEKNPEKAVALNVEGSLKWYHACVETGCNSFVYVSTSHVYAPSKNKLKPMDPTGPRSVYSKTKLQAEDKLRAVAQAETPLTIARVFSVLPHTLRPGYLLTNLHLRAKNKDFSPIPGLSYVRDFLTSEAICKRLMGLATTPLGKTQIVNVCSGQGRTVKDLAVEVFTQHGLSIDQLVEAPARPNDNPYIVGEPSSVLIQEA